MDDKLEAAVLEKLDAGDVNGACTAVIGGYGPQLLGYLTAVLRDETLAGDAFSELSLDLLNGLPGFRREASVRTFAYKLAWHAALRVARDPYQRRRDRLASDDISELVAKVRSETAAHLKTEVKDRVAQLRRQLDREEQSLLILRVDRDLSWKEIAEVLGVDEAAARKRFERTKEKLRRLVDAQKGQ